jgi:hypothetical protein
LRRSNAKNQLKFNADIVRRVESEPFKFKLNSAENACEFVKNTLLFIALFVSLIYGLPSHAQSSKNDQLNGEALSYYSNELLGPHF